MSRNDFLDYKYPIKDFYAHEKYAENIVLGLQALVNVAYLQRGHITELKRSNAALRGQITKLKKKLAEARHD